ncbi:MAG: hypothetical protein ABFD79_03040 [Phycisphaerales bacterium]
MHKAFRRRAKTRLYCIVVFLFFINGNYANASSSIICKSGILTQDETWYAANTYFIIENLTIDDGVELTIEPGTVIKFENGKYFNAIEGILNISGDAYNYIIFTSKYDSEYGAIIDSNLSPWPGCWNGLYTSQCGNISFCKVCWAVNAIDVLWQASVSGKIENNIISNFSDSGISGFVDYAAYGTYQIKNNLITNDSPNNAAGIYFMWENLSDAVLEISNNTLAKNYYDIYFAGYSIEGRADIFNNIFNSSRPRSMYWEETKMRYSYNGFYNSLPVGSNYAVCTCTPFDTANTSLGSYFLNNNQGGGGLLINAGRDPDNEGMQGHTTSWNQMQDDAPVDIGFHYPKRNEYFIRVSNTTPGRDGLTNPFNSIEEIRANTCPWDIIHILTDGETDSNLATIFETTDWPDRQYYSHEVYRNGIRWTFDDEYRIGQFCNGDFWILAPVEINSVTPAPAGSGVSFRNGSMLNPIGNLYHAYDGRGEGFNPDQIIQYPLILDGVNSLISSASIIAQPTDCTYGYLDMSDYCVRYNYQGDFHSYLYSAAVLTTLPSVPPPNIFRPPYAGTEKPFFDKNSLRTDLLPALPLTSKPSLLHLNWVAREFQNTWLDHKNHSSVRLIHPVKNMPNYGREIGTATNQASCLLMLDYTAEQLNPLLIGFVQTGIDLYYNRINGTTWAGEAGHDNGRKWPIIFAGIMLDNDGMKNISQTYNLLGAEDTQTYYNSSGKALWGRNCVSQYTKHCEGSGARDCRDADQLVDGCPSYRNCCTSNTWVGQAIAIKIVGAENLWLHDEFFDYVHRWVTADVTGGGEILGGHYIRDMWNLFWPAGITIIDNGLTGSTASTGSWTFSSALNPYSTSSLLSANGATYTWIFKPQETAYYNVAIWWTSAEARSCSIPVNIQHSSGGSNLVINQQLFGGQWFSLGDFSMIAGNTYNVKITAPSGGSQTTCADAVKFESKTSANISPTASIISISPNPSPVGQTISFTGSATDTDGSILAYNWHSSRDGVLSAQLSFDSNNLSEGSHAISFIVCDNQNQWSQPATQSIFIGEAGSTFTIDNGDPQTSCNGIWSISTAPDPYGSNSFWGYSGSTYSWNFIPDITSTYKVSMWWTALASRSTAVPVEIQNSGQTDYLTINQTENGGKWNELGQYPMNAGVQYSITITAPIGSPPSTCADAVQFERITTGKIQPQKSPPKLPNKKSPSKKSTGFFKF